MNEDHQPDGLLGRATWRDVLIALIAAAALVAMSFAPPAGCKVSVGSPTTTTTSTEPDR